MQTNVRKRKKSDNVSWIAAVLNGAKKSRDANFTHLVQLMRHGTRTSSPAEKRVNLYFQNNYFNSMAPTLLSLSVTRQSDFLEGMSNFPLSKNVLDIGHCPTKSWTWRIMLLGKEGRDIWHFAIWRLNFVIMNFKMTTYSSNLTKKFFHSDMKRDLFKGHICGFGFKLTPGNIKGRGFQNMNGISHTK